jgi:hypothetical protein
MPILRIYSPQPVAPDGLLERLCAKICERMPLPRDRAWAFWMPMQPGNYHRPDWAPEGSKWSPAVLITCQQKHAADAVSRMMETVRTELATTLGCPSERVFVAVQRVSSSEVLELPPSS